MIIKGSKAPASNIKTPSGFTGFQQQAISATQDKTHTKHFQGLLKAPRISSIFDHEILKKGGQLNTGSPTSKKLQDDDNHKQQIELLKNLKNNNQEYEIEFTHIENQKEAEMIAHNWEQVNPGWQWTGFFSKATKQTGAKIRVKPLPRLIEEIRKNSHLFDEKAPILLPNDKRTKGQAASGNQDTINNGVYGNETDTNQTKVIFQSITPSLDPYGTQNNNVIALPQIGGQGPNTLLHASAVSQNNSQIQNASMINQTMVGDTTHQDIIIQGSNQGTQNLTQGVTGTSQQPQPHLTVQDLSQMKPSTKGNLEDGDKQNSPQKEIQDTQENEQVKTELNELDKNKNGQDNRDQSNSPAGAGFKIEEIKPLAIPMQIQQMQSESNRNVVKLTYGAGLNQQTTPSQQANLLQASTVNAVGTLNELPTFNRNSKKDHSLTSQHVNGQGAKSMDGPSDISPHSHFQILRSKLQKANQPYIQVQQQPASNVNMFNQRNGSHNAVADQIDDDIGINPLQNLDPQLKPVIPQNIVNDGQTAVVFSQYQQPAQYPQTPNTNVLGRSAVVGPNGNLGQFMALQQKKRGITNAQQKRGPMQKYGSFGQSNQSTYYNQLGSRHRAIDQNSRVTSLKHKKDMCQLKFYQTVNNYPNQLKMQQQQQQQLLQQRQQDYQTNQLAFSDANVNKMQDVTALSGKQPTNGALSSNGNNMGSTQPASSRMNHPQTMQQQDVVINTGGQIILKQGPQSGVGARKDSSQFDLKFDQKQSYLNPYKILKSNIRSPQSNGNQESDMVNKYGTQVPQVGKRHQQVVQSIDETLGQKQNHLNMQPKRDKLNTQSGLRQNTYNKPPSTAGKYPPQSHISNVARSQTNANHRDSSLASRQGHHQNMQQNQAMPATLNNIQKSNCHTLLREVKDSQSGKTFVNSEVNDEQSRDTKRNNQNKLINNQVQKRNAVFLQQNAGPQTQVANNQDLARVSKMKQVKKNTDHIHGMIVARPRDSMQASINSQNSISKADKLKNIYNQTDSQTVLPNINKDGVSSRLTNQNQNTAQFNLQLSYRQVKDNNQKYRAEQSNPNLNNDIAQWQQIDGGDSLNNYYNGNNNQVVNGSLLTMNNFKIQKCVLNDFSGKSGGSSANPNYKTDINGKLLDTKMTSDQDNNIVQIHNAKEKAGSDQIQNPNEISAQIFNNKVISDNTLQSNVNSSLLNETQKQLMQEGGESGANKGSQIQQPQQAQINDSFNGRKKCKRFMSRGNNPTKPNYEEQDVVVPMRPEDTNNMLVPYTGQTNRLTSQGGAMSSFNNQVKDTNASMLYGINLEQFDEEVSGINLTKLFSVYGPQSSQGKRKKMSAAGHKGGKNAVKGQNQDIANAAQLNNNAKIANQGAANNDQTGKPLSPKSQFDAIFSLSNSYQQPGANAGTGIGGPNSIIAVDTKSNQFQVGLDNQQTLRDGSTNNKDALVQGGFNDFNQRTQQVEAYISFQKPGSQQRNPDQAGNINGSQPLGTQADDFDFEDEPLVIKLMASMFTKKKSVQERIDMDPTINLEKLQEDLRRDLKLIAKYERDNIEKLENEKFNMERLEACQRLYEQIPENGFMLIEKAMKRKMAHDQAQTDKIRNNQFFIALEAQRKYRDDLKKMQKDLKLNNVINTDPDEQIKMIEYKIDQNGKQAEFSEKSQEPKILEDDQNEKKPDFDLFKHTQVDTEDQNDDPNLGGRNALTNMINGKKKQPKDCFMFYNFQFDLPTSYYNQLGDFSAISANQITQIKKFMQEYWPQLKDKKISLKVALDAEKEVVNVILLGKECPLSKCCKMTVCFQFTKDIGGKVICMESLCAFNPMDHFFVDFKIIETIFYPPQNTTPAIIPDSSAQNQNLMEIQKQYYAIHLKPVFTKIISNEISKIVSRGDHFNQSFRECLTSQKFLDRNVMPIIQQKSKWNADIILQLYQEQAAEFDKIQSKNAVSQQTSTVGGQKVSQSQKLSGLQEQVHLQAQAYGIDLMNADLNQMSANSNTTQHLGQSNLQQMQHTSSFPENQHTQILQQYGLEQQQNLYLMEQDQVNQLFNQSQSHMQGQQQTASVGIYDPSSHPVVSDMNHDDDEEVNILHTFHQQQQEQLIAQQQTHNLVNPLINEAFFSQSNEQVQGENLQPQHQMQMPNMMSDLPSGGNTQGLEENKEQTTTYQQEVQQIDENINVVIKSTSNNNEQTGEGSQAQPKNDNEDHKQAEKLVESQERQNEGTEGQDQQI